MPEPKTARSARKERRPFDIQTALSSGRHVIVTPREGRLACGSSRHIWPEGQPLLAVAIHHGDERVAFVLMPRSCGDGARRLGTFRIADMVPARVPKRLRPPPATGAEIRQVAAARAATDDFIARVSETPAGQAPAASKIVEFKPLGTLPDRLEDRATA